PAATISPKRAEGEPLKAKAPRLRRWILVAGGVVVLLVLAGGGGYVWGWVSAGESTSGRAVVWGGAGVGGQHRFPARPILAAAHASALPREVEANLALSGKREDLDQFLRDTDTLAFIVVHRDGLVRERYFDGATRESLQTSFSAAKSVVSTLV